MSVYKPAKSITTNDVASHDDGVHAAQSVEALAELRRQRYAQQKAWRDANPDLMRRKRREAYARRREKERAYQRAYYAANAERLSARALARAAGRQEETRAEKALWVAKDRVRFRSKHLWMSAKRRAVRRGLEFTISIEDVVIPTHCPVLGIEILVEAGKSVQPGAPSIDRIDNSLGYTPANVRVISHRANALKRDATRAEAALVYENWFAR